MKRIGIPRALLYYQYFPMWRTFFETLGAQVVVSLPTNREVVTTGQARLVAETCLPVKIYAGHVCWLRDQGADSIFIPAIRSVEDGAYNCGKFLGLPDLMKAVVEDCPPLLEIDLDVPKGQRELYKAIYGLGRHFTANPLKIKKAAEAAWQAHLGYQARLRTGLTPLEVLEDTADMFHVPRSQFQVGGTRNVRPGTLAGTADFGLRTSSLTVAVVGHPYCVYDTFMNHDLLAKLRQMGVRVVTYEMAPEEGIEEGIRRLAGTKYWTYEGEVVGAAGYYFQEPQVDGVISVAVFACGPDSTMLEVVRHAAKKEGQRYMSLIIDEHTAEAGLVTRLEAFVDMLARCKRRASPPPGLASCQGGICPAN